MKNKTMKLFSKFLILSLIFNIIMFGVTVKASAENMSYEIVLDKESGRVLYAKNENICVPMASTTKVLTCITIIENYDLKYPWNPKKGAEGNANDLRKFIKEKHPDIEYYHDESIWKYLMKNYPEQMKACGYNL